MLRSFIFSFDTLKVRWKIPRCLLFAVICIGLVEILLGRTDFIWRQVPNSGIGEFLALEESIIQKYSKPDVLIFGSSRGRAAFLPTVMEEQMGLQRGQVLNLGMGGGRPFDALKIYERNRKILAQTDIIIIEVDAEQFGTLLTKLPNDRFRYLMGLSDWLTCREISRLSLSKSFLFRLPDTFPYLRSYTKYWLAERHAPEALNIDKYGRLSLERITDDYDENVFREETIRNMMEILYRDYEYSETSEKYLLKLVRLAKDDGASVYIVHIPLFWNYMNKLKHHHKNPYGQFKKNVSNAAAGRVNGLQFWESASDVGLNNHDFRDLEHLNAKGAIKWTKFFVRWLRTVHGEKKHD